MFLKTWSFPSFSHDSKRWWEKPVAEYECHSGQKSLDQRLELLQDISRAFTNAGKYRTYSNKYLMQGEHTPTPCSHCHGFIDAN